VYADNPSILQLDVDPSADRQTDLRQCVMPSCGIRNNDGFLLNGTAFVFINITSNYVSSSDIFMNENKIKKRNLLAERKSRSLFWRN